MTDISTRRAHHAYEVSVGAMPDPTPVFVAGDHWLESGEKLRVSTYEFSSQAFEQIIYAQRKLAGPGMPIPGVFLFAGSPIIFSPSGDVMPFDSAHARLLLGKFVKLAESPKPRGANQEVEYRDVPASIDHAGLLVTYATHYAMPVEAVVHHLAYTRKGERMDRGWYPSLRTVVTRPEASEAFASEEVPIWDLVSDFCLDDESKSHLLALLLTIMFRPMLNGNVPLFVVNAAMERSGKTKLIQDVVGPIVLGNPIPTWTMPNDADEMTKQITSKLLAGRPVLLADNRATKLDSPELASMITSRTISGRKLGKSLDLEFKNVTTIIVTGNAMECSSEIAKRALTIEVNPGTDSPETRTNFRHADLIGAVVKRAAGVRKWLDRIIGEWADAECPKCEKPFGGFERWMDTVGSILVFHGYPLMHERAVAVRKLDPLDSEFLRFIERWADVLGDGPVRSEELLTMLKNDGDIWPEVLAGQNDRAHQIALGRKLAKAVDRVTMLENGVRVRISKKHSGSARRYVLAVVEV